MKKHNIPSIVCSLLTVALIIFLLGTVVCDIGIPKYPRIENGCTFLLCVLLLILLPAVLIFGAVTGIRKNLTWYSIMILTCSIFYIPLWFFAYLGTSTIFSVTSDIANYGQFDAFVDTYMQNNDGYELLNVDQDVGTITEYYYSYCPMERTFVVFADVSFLNMDAYKKEQQRLSAFEQEASGDFIQLSSVYTHVGTIRVDPDNQSISYFITNDIAQSLIDYTCRIGHIT